MKLYISKTGKGREITCYLTKLWPTIRISARHCLAFPGIWLASYLVLESQNRVVVPLPGSLALSYLFSLGRTPTGTQLKRACVSQRMCRKQPDTHKVASGS